MNEYGVATSTDTVRMERMLPGPIERVWAYLTESERRATWLAAGEMDLVVGGRVDHEFRNSELCGHDDPAPAKYEQQGCSIQMQGSITACEPPRLLAYTWAEDSGDPSEVRFELSPRGDQVHLVVVHTRLTERDAMISVAAGWHTHLGILDDRLAGRAPEPFWPAHERLAGEYAQRLA